MARVAPTPHVPTSRRLRYTFMLIFLASSFAAAWLVRIRPVLTGQPVGIDEFSETGLLTFPAGARPPLLIREHYTGIESIDAFVRLLVGAFLPGPAYYEPRIWLHQFYFLLSFTPILSIALVESCRYNRRGHLFVGYTWFWATLYQTVAGAIAMPLYLICYISSSAWTDIDWDEPEHNILTFSTEVDQLSAKTLLPTVLLGYITPTLIMYLAPPSDLNRLMIFVAYWQITPITLDPIMAVLKLILSPRTFRERLPRPDYGSGRPDTAYLYPLYAVSTAVAGGAHVFTMYKILTSAAPREMFSTVLLPDSVDAMRSTFAGFHNIFQWDWIFVAAQFILLALYGVYDLKVAGATSVHPVLATIAVLLAAVALGPGGSLALTWWWREGRLVELLADINVRKQAMDQKRLSRKKR